MSCTPRSPSTTPSWPTRRRVRAIVKEELLEIKEKFNDPRRTELAAVEGEVDIEDLIPQEECVVTLTHFGYLKRQPLDVYKTQRRGGRGHQRHEPPG